MEKIWISGAKGHVGSALVKMLDFEKYKYVATDKDEVDITNMEAVHSFCKINRPDIIINCSGLTDLQECEANPDLAYAVNAVGVRNIAQEAQEIGAKLISYGFPFNELIEETFYQKTYLQNQLLGRALLESIRIMDGRVIVSCLDRKAIEFYESVTQDYEGIVNQLRNTKGVDCAIFMYEFSPMTFKVSLRSNEKVDVSKVAEFFGGGGHKRAAGCTLNGTYYDVVNNVAAQIEKWIQ